MSLRTLPENAAERIAALEEFVRRLQGDNAISPTDTRYLYTAKGDVLIAAGTGDPQPLPPPPASPIGPGRWILAWDPGSPLGIDWYWHAG